MRRYGMAYREHYPVSGVQLQAIRDLSECRTAILGGHVSGCNECGQQQIAYNSCRNRHCPKCGSLLKAEWVQQQLQHLLPTHYFHVVFTIDHDLIPLIRVNQTALYGLLMRTAAKALQQMADQELGGQVGIMAILHTWGQQLTEHPHVHCLVTGGALSHNQRKWRSTKPDFLFPIEELSVRFKQQLCHAIAALYASDKLTFAGQSLVWADPDSFAQRLKAAQAKNWMVYAKPPFADAEQVVAYLGRYTHRIAISNHRILSIEEDRVSFSYRDYRHEGQLKTLTLDALEFLRRFLSHVLPRAFVRIRYYGLLATGQRAKKLTICRQLLSTHAAEIHKPLSRVDLLVLMLGRQPHSCPHCQKGTLQQLFEIKPHPYRRGWLRAIRG